MKHFHLRRDTLHENPARLIGGRCQHGHPCSSVSSPNPPLSPHGEPLSDEN